MIATRTTIDAFSIIDSPLRFQSPTIVRNPAFLLPAALNPKSSSSSALNMAKKKRKRKAPVSDVSSRSTPSIEVNDSSEDDDDLPDFDLTPTVQSSEASPVGNSFESNDELIAKAMKGSSKNQGKAPSSVEDLISDRSLEKSFQFDSSNVKEKLPTFSDVSNKSAKAGGEGVKIGKKAARAEARRAAAIEANKKDEGLLSRFLGGNEESSFDWLEIVKNGTWVGIFLLIAWEIFINTPLFERAGPLVPVVYDLFL